MVCLTAGLKHTPPSLRGLLSLSENQENQSYIYNTVAMKALTICTRTTTIKNVDEPV